MSPRPGSGCSSSLQSNGICDGHKETVVGCWFCAGGNCLGFCTRCFRQAHVHTGTLNSCVLHECNDCSFVDKECLMLTECTNGSEIRYCVQDSPVQRIATSETPRFRVVAHGKKPIAAYMLKSGFVDSISVCQSTLRKAFVSFDFCRHSFYFLSRFLVKYFKYFKCCGVTI